MKSNRLSHGVQILLMGSGITSRVPYATDFESESDKEALKKALAYMGLEEGAPLTSIDIQHVFIGSCTNARLSDLRAAAKVIEGKKVHPAVTAIVVPGSYSVKKQAEQEGLDSIFLEAGFEWRESGCSMCLAMNDDVVPAGERCASTSNRNFEGRQGAGARTHLTESGNGCGIRDCVVDSSMYVKFKRLMPN